MIERAACRESLAPIREWIESRAMAAGLDEPERFALVLATDEACANVIEHGYAGREPGTLRIDFEHVAAPAGVEARVTIVDGGRPFEPGEAPVPDITSSSSARAAGGLGWHFIRSVIDEIHYLPDAVAGNRLTLIKRAPPPSRDATRAHSS